MTKPYVPGPPDPRPNPLHSIRAEDAAPNTPRRRPARRGRYLIESRVSGQWTDDGIGVNPLRSLTECRADIQALRRIVSDDPAWAGEYAIVREDGEVVQYYRL